MILLAFLISTASAHPCDAAFWKGKVAHRQCIVDQWNKHYDPLGLRATPLYTKLGAGMDFSQVLVISPYHMDLWLKHRKPEPLRRPDIEINGFRVFIR